jgi:hypothetical protein
MGLYKTGIVNSTKGTSQSSPSVNFQTQIDNLKGQSVAARVTDIVLDENHPRFNDVGQWNGIGAIFYELVNQSGTSTNFNYALPYDSQLKTYPLVNEIVLLFSLPNQQMGSNTTNTSYFYFKPLGIWNHPHHDAYPNLLNGKLKNKQESDYSKTDNGVVRRVEDSSTDIELNSPVNPSQNTFVEKTNIHPLMPFMGDSLFEGRHGQSLRFGSTAKSKSQYVNSWSTAGENGDPITILRNGQPKNVSDKGWLPITENISNDLSSIYLTSTQKLSTLSLTNENFVSYTTPPITPAIFNSPQIVLNSDRVILNAKTDSILISGQKSVGLSSNDSINLEATGEINISSKLTRLGNIKANQSVLRGDETVAYLKILITELQNIAEALKVVQDWPSGAPVPNHVILTAANSALEVFENVYNEIDSVKSKIVKTV